MRTTITIDDGLLDQVRRRAMELGQTVSRMIEDSVREKLQRVEATEMRRYTVRGFHGGRPPGTVNLDDNRELLDVMDER